MHAALLTGFADDGAFDPRRQCNITDYVLRQGLTGLYVGGSSGESGLMTIDELLEQQAVVAERAASGGIALIAHIGMPSVRDSIRLAKQAEALGYHALSALPPHAYPFSDEEICDYYRQVTAATSLPMIVYEIPARTHRAIPLDTLECLLCIPGVFGIKFTSSDLHKYAQLRARCPDKMYFFGFDEIFVAAGMLGVDGGIGTTYNVFGRLFVALNEAVRAGDLKSCRDLQARARAFVDLLLEVGVIPGTKAALRAIGIDCGATRAPMKLRSENAEARIREFLEQPDVAAWLA